MASKTLDKCCTEGIKHTGTPLGEFIRIEDIEAYASGNKSASQVIIIYSDIFGHSFVNTQLIADSFAKENYFVIVPDLFKGDSLRPGGTLTPEWKEKHSISNTLPLSEATINWVKRSPRKFIGAIGYCYGAPFVIKQLACGELQAGAIAHPSSVDVVDLKRLSSDSGPLLVSAAEVDPIFSPKIRVEFEEVLRENSVFYHITLASGVRHGFAVRGDPTKRVDRIAKEKAFDDQLWWFKINQHGLLR